MAPEFARSPGAVFFANGDGFQGPLEMLPG